MVKILVTGGAGFVGNSCLNVFEKTDFEIHALYRNTLPDKPNLTWHPCNLLDSEQVKQTIKEIRPNYLIHLAWFVDHGVFWSSEKNIDYIQATVNLYREFSMQGGKKAIFLGTCAEYDWSYSDCEEEKTPLYPNTLYGVAKKQTFELLSQIKKNNPTYAPFTWVRIFNIYGSNENPARLIPHIFCSYLKNNTPVINNPYAIRDYLNAVDLGEMILHLLQSHYEGAINVGHGIELSIAELAQIIHARYFNELNPPFFGANIMQREDRLIPNLAKLKSLDIKSKATSEKRLDETFNWWASSIALTKN